MTKYKIIWTNKGSFVHEESFFAQDVQEAVRNITLRSKEITNLTFDEVKLVKDFE